MWHLISPSSSFNPYMSCSRKENAIFFFIFEKLSIYYCFSLISKSRCSIFDYIFQIFKTNLYLDCFPSSHFVKGDTPARSSRMNQKFSNISHWNSSTWSQERRENHFNKNNNWCYFRIRSREIKDEFKEFWIYRFFAVDLECF